MTYRVRKPLLWSLILTAALIGVTFGFATGRASSPSLTDDDIIPAGVSNCLIGIMTRFGTLDPNTASALNPDVVDELAPLPARCLEDPDVHAVLEAEYPATLACLERIPIEGNCHLAEPSG